MAVSAGLQSSPTSVRTTSNRSVWWSSYTTRLDVTRGRDGNNENDEQNESRNTDPAKNDPSDCQSVTSLTTISAAYLAACQVSKYQGEY
jgi:hypothetical protein